MRLGLWIFMAVGFMLYSGTQKESEHTFKMLKNMLILKTLIDFRHYIKTFLQLMPTHKKIGW